MEISLRSWLVLWHAHTVPYSRFFSRTVPDTPRPLQHCVGFFTFEFQFRKKKTSEKVTKTFGKTLCGGLCTCGRKHNNKSYMSGMSEIGSLTTM